MPEDIKTSKKCERMKTLVGMYKLVMVLMVELKLSVNFNG